MNKLYILLAILMMAGCSGSANRNGSEEDNGISSGTDSSVSTGVNSSSSSGSDTNTSSSVSSSSSGTISDEVTCKAFWDNFPKEIVGKDYEWVQNLNSITYSSLRAAMPSSVNLDLDPTNPFIFSSSLDTEKNVIYWGGNLITADSPLCIAYVVTTSTNNVVSANAKVDIVISSIKYNNVTL